MSNNSNTLKLLITDSSVILTKENEVIIERVFESIDDFGNDLKLALKKNANRNTIVECFLAGIKVFSQTHIIHYENKDKFTADSGITNRLIENARQEFIKVAKQSGMPDPEIFEESIRSKFLNGYPVSEFKKEVVEDIKIIIFFSAFSTSFKGKLTSYLTSIKHIEFKYQSLAKSLATKVLKLSNNPSFMICSAYEKSTEISLQKSDNFFEVITIPVGTHDAGDTDFKEKLSIESKKTFATLSDGIILPENLYLTVSPEYIELYSSIYSQFGFDVKDISSILNP